MIDVAEAIFRAADILVRHKVRIDLGPGRHGITRGTTIYFLDPSGTSLETGADCSWGREGIATKIRYAFGISHQRFQRRPMPDAMPYGQHTRR